MSFFHEKIILIFLLISCISNFVSARGAVYTPPKVPPLTDHFSRLRVDQNYYVLYGEQNIKMMSDGFGSTLILNKSSGSGLVSRNKYSYGFFSAAIKLPSGFTSGVVVAFYLSNSDIYPHNHDEIDIELLGHEKKRDWVLQTNIYGNGSVHTGREEKLYMWFDPTQDFHQYSILWNTHHIVFLVDNVPVRELINNVASSSFYPSKPMSVYATIWDASQWATHGGKYPVNYQYAPFVALFNEMKMEGCVWHPTNSSSTSCSKPALSSLDPVGGAEFAKLGPEQVNGLEWTRHKLMFYSYCRDTARYKVLPPECANNAN